MDHLKGGNIREFLQQNGKNINLEKKLRKLLDITVGLNFIHDQNLTHQDLHSGNVLNDEYGGGDGDGIDRIFISDFGQCSLAKYQKEGKIFGVLPYVAPEVLLGKTYTQASDVYSFGIVAYELLTNSYPYYEKYIES